MHHFCSTENNYKYLFLKIKLIIRKILITKIIINKYIYFYLIYTNTREELYKNATSSLFLSNFLFYFLKVHDYTKQGNNVELSIKEQNL